MGGGGVDALVARLRAAGCVFAEDEAAELRRWARDDVELAEWTDRRVDGEPLEHIVGHVRFGDIDLVVGPGAFVPRQRSLLLASVVLDLARARTDAVVVEAFCGVAPIATCLASVGITAVAADSDPVALAYAERNLSPRDVFRADVLSGMPTELRSGVDVIAAVPPYVPADALATMPHEAVDHEPSAALVGGGVLGLAAAERLLRDAPGWLRADGAVAIEMNVGQVASAADISRSVGFTTRAVNGDDGQTAVLIAAR